MRNVKSYQGDTFEFHQKMVDGKKDSDAKRKLKSIEIEIKNQFKVYDTEFTSNTLENIKSSSLCRGCASELKDNYKYDCSLIKKLRKELTTDEQNRIQKTCPYCTISEEGSLDHYLPKGEFPEFSVNPKNLFPCCSICNSYKSEKWLEDGKRHFLNLYLDKLPRVQYLFVDFDIDGDLFTPVFKLKNAGNINTDLFALIESHYMLLHLLDRFSENSSNVISELHHLIQNLIPCLPFNQIKECILNIINQERDIWGYNYWKSTLKSALVNNEDYMSQF